MPEPKDKVSHSKLSLRVMMWRSISLYIVDLAGLEWTSKRRGDIPRYIYSASYSKLGVLKK